MKLKLSTLVIIIVVIFFIYYYFTCTNKNNYENTESQSTDDNQMDNDNFTPIDSNNYDYTNESFQVTPIVDDYFQENLTPTQSNNVYNPKIQESIAGNIRPDNVNKVDEAVTYIN